MSLKYAEVCSSMKSAKEFIKNKHINPDYISEVVVIWYEEEDVD